MRVVFPTRSHSGQVGHSLLVGGLLLHASYFVLHLGTRGKRLVRSGREGGTARRAARSCECRCAGLPIGDSHVRRAVQTPACAASRLRGTRGVRAEGNGGGDGDGAWERREGTWLVRGRRGGGAGPIESSAPVTQQMSAVLLLPPSPFLRRCVNFESRYGMK